MTGWPRTSHRRLLLPQQDTLNWDAIAPSVIGDQLELLGQQSNLVLSADIPADAGSMAALAGSGASFFNWMTARLASRNSTVGGPTLFALAGIVVPPSGFGTDGHMGTAIDVDRVDDIEADDADAIADGDRIYRHPIGFSLSDGFFFDGTHPLLPLPQVVFRPIRRYGATGLTASNKTYSSGTVSESGSVSPGTPAQFHLPFIVPADFSAWLDASGLPGTGAWATVRMTGTLSCSLSMLDTTGTESTLGTASTVHGVDVRVTLDGAAMAGLTFTPGETAHLVVNFAPGASGGTATLRLMPIARYQPIARSNI